MNDAFVMSDALKERLRSKSTPASADVALAFAIPAPQLVTAAALGPFTTYLSLNVEAVSDLAVSLLRLNDAADFALAGMVPELAVAYMVPNALYYLAYTAPPATYQVPGPGAQGALHLESAGGADFIAYPAWEFVPGDPWGLDIWIRTTQNPGSPAVIVQKSDGTTWPFRLRLLPGGTVEGSRADGTHTPTVASTVVVNDGAWHYVSLVGGATIGIQVDNTTAVTASDTAVSPVNNAATVHLGLDTLVADLADFGVYRSALSAGARTRHQAATLGTLV